MKSMHIVTHEMFTVLLFLRWWSRLRTTYRSKRDDILFWDCHKIQWSCWHPSHFLEVSIVAPRVGSWCEEFWCGTANRKSPRWWSHGPVPMRMNSIRPLETITSPWTWFGAMYTFFLGNKKILQLLLILQNADAEYPIIFYWDTSIDIFNRRKFI